METFVEIINKNACQPSSGLVIDGIEANSNEWKKHNFYPQNGIVGVVLGEGQMFSGTILIIQVWDKLIVPIEPSGVRYITETEFNKRIGKNLEIGLDRNNENKNSHHKQIMNDLEKMMGF